MLEYYAFVKSAKYQQGITVPILVLWAYNETLSIPRAQEQFGKANVFVCKAQSFGEAKDKAKNYFRMD
jgi:hypothetical protein